jgi:hypothetical protein
MALSGAIVHPGPKKSRGARAIVAGDPAFQTIDRSNGAMRESPAAEGHLPASLKPCALLITENLVSI